MDASGPVNHFSDKLVAMSGGGHLGMSGVELECECVTHRECSRRSAEVAGTFRSSCRHRRRTRPCACPLPCPSAATSRMRVMSRVFGQLDCLPAHSRSQMLPTTAASLCRDCSSARTCTPHIPSFRLYSFMFVNSTRLVGIFYISECSFRIWFPMQCFLFYYTMPV